MINYISATVDGQTYYFERQINDEWRMTASAPMTADVYDVTLQITKMTGQTFTFTSKELGELLKLVVIPNDRDIWLMGYLPDMFHQTTELLAVFKPEEDELRGLYSLGELALEENFILSASEIRIRQIERGLGIIPSGELLERKNYILSLYRRSISNMLNETVIKNVVNALTGGSAIVSFGDSVVTVKVLPPKFSYEVDLSAVTRALQPRMPAHLGLSVIRHYAKWSDVANFHASWGTLKDALPDWKAVRDTVYG